MVSSLFNKQVNVVLFFILLIVTVLRIPNLFEPYWYGDEGIYLTVGEGLRQGELLYKDIFDHKPPAIYILAAIAGSLSVFKLFLLLSSLLSIIFFWKLAGKIFKEAALAKENYLTALYLSTFIFALLTTLPTLEGNIANAELFMMLPTIFGMLLLFSLKKGGAKHYFYGGLIFSLAFLFKVPAFFDLAALVLYWFFVSFGKSREMVKCFKNISILGIGFLIPIIIIILYFISKNAFPYFLEGAFSQNLSYITSWSTPKLPSGDSVFLSGNLSFRFTVLSGLIFILFLFKQFINRSTLFVCIWFIFSIFAFLLSGRPYPHYIIQALPPAAIALSLLLFGAQKYRFWVVPVFLIFLASLVFYKFHYYPILPYYSNFINKITGQITKDEYFAKFDKRVPQTYKIANYLSERSNSQDRVFIWGTEPEIYSLARRLSPGRYTTSFHIVDFNGQKETIKSLRDNHPKYIVLMENERREFPEFFDFLQENYVYIQNIESAQIWLRLKIAF